MTLDRVVLMPLSLTNTSLRPKICGGIQEIFPAEYPPHRLSNAGGEAYPERARMVLPLETQARRLGGASIREIPEICSQFENLLPCESTASPLQFR